MADDLAPDVAEHLTPWVRARLDALLSWLSSPWPLDDSRAVGERVQVCAAIRQVFGYWPGTAGCRRDGEDALSCEEESDVR